jgi:16S rRNA (guanine527-N7)-methyltransferase
MVTSMAPTLVLPLAEMREAAARLGVLDHAERIAGPLERYLELLLKWNARVNLTAVRRPEEIVVRHFVDSLMVVPWVPKGALRAIDVGSGPGLPGAVLALARPDLQVTLVESNHKKTAFLETLRRELPAPNLRVLAVRVESLFDRPDFMPFDVAVSRATLELPKWLALGRRLCRTDGVVLGMEGTERHALPPGATRHPYSMGGLELAIVVLPGSA